MDKVREARQRTRPVVDPNITMNAYAEQWLATIEATVKPRTRKSYGNTLRLHILPDRRTPGSGPFTGPDEGPPRREAPRREGQEVIEGESHEGGPVPLARESVRIIHATLRAMLNAAVEDGMIVVNPSNRLGRQLRLVRAAQARQEEIKAMTCDQVATFLAASLGASTAYERRHYPLFLLLCPDGNEIGRGPGPAVGRRGLRSARDPCRRAFSTDRVEDAEVRAGRTVDMSEQLARVLLRLQVERKTETLRRGWASCRLGLLHGGGTPLDESRVRKVFTKTLRASGLPLHFTPHCLRHTFASLLLQQGESPAYVQRQLGHASIQLTVDTYGKWLPMGNKAAVNRLDDPSGSKVVAKQNRALPSSGSARFHWWAVTDSNRGPAD